MNTVELSVVSFTLGRQTRIASLLKMCGVYATAKHLRNKGYTLEQTLSIISVSK